MRPRPIPTILTLTQKSILESKSVEGRYQGACGGKAKTRGARKLLRVTNEQATDFLLAIPG